MKREMGNVVLVAAVVAQLGCADKSPTGPSAASLLATQPAAAGTGGSVSAANQPPKLVVRTQPEADYSTDPPTITVVSNPAKVTFGMCQTTDPDGDSMNHQVNFGDSGRPAFNTDGTFNPDHEHQCRAEHVYAEGTYTATVSVTDKHLEDQGRDVRSLARSTQRFRVKVTPYREEGCAGSGVNINFDSAPPGPFTSLSFPGATVTPTGVFAVIDAFTSPSPLPPMSDRHVVAVGDVEIAFTEDQASYRFDIFPIGGTVTTVNGFDAGGAPTFTHTFPAPTVVPPAQTLDGNGRFRKLVISPGFAFLMDNFSTSCR